MANLFDAMPGVLLPVKDIAGTLSRMWQSDAPSAAEAPSAFRASQMNVVLQFGEAATPDDAKRIFDQAIQFAQVYPCRIVVLCPVAQSQLDSFRSGKLFSECFIGPSTREMCCCEALMFYYPLDTPGYLENQISIWLENDLPVYHWLHRVPAASLEKFYLPYLKTCTRIVYDSSVEGKDYADVKWPKPEFAMDLAYARLLPVRQSIGQFLSSYDPAALVKSLARVECRTAPGAEGEAANLLRWQQECLEGCGARCGQKGQITYATGVLGASSPNSIEVEWQYDGGAKKFLWEHAKNGDDVRVSANFGKGPIELPQQVKPMPRVRELAEALFF